MRVVLTSGEGFTGAFIRWYTWSWAAHAAIQLDDGTYIDATPSAGVSHHDNEVAKTIHYYDVVYPNDSVKAYVEKHGLHWLSLQLGKPYDWSAIYGMAFRRDWHDPSHWFCSEAVEGLFDSAGYPLVAGSAILDRVTPRDLTLSPRLKLSQIVTR